MKKVFLLLFICFIAVASFAQTQDIPPPVPRAPSSGCAPSTYGRSTMIEQWKKQQTFGDDTRVESYETVINGQTWYCYNATNCLNVSYARKPDESNDKKEVWVR